MTLVDAQRLNQFMSEPKWSSVQWLDAGDFCETVERELADRLNTKITPVLFSETVTLLDTGLAATTYPVYSVSRLGDTDVTALPDGSLPDGWTWSDTEPPRRLRYLGNSLSGGFGLMPLYPSTLGSYGRAGRLQGWGTIGITYMAGIGNSPALRKAILTKAAVYMKYRYDDSVQISNMDVTRVRSDPNEPKMAWTDDDLAPLQIYRNVKAWK